MKSGFAFLLFCLSYVTLVRAAVTPPVIPAKLFDHHTITCPEFGTERGKYYMSAAYTLPKSEYSTETKTLYVLGCEMYAYNSLEKAYILDEKENITDVYVAEVDYARSITATANLMGAGFDEKSFKLYTFQKGRGIGDCGATSTHAYSPEAEKFILIEARIKNNCDGDVEAQWPVVYSKM